MQMIDFMTNLALGIGFLSFALALLGLFVVWKIDRYRQSKEYRNVYLKD